MEPNYTVVAYKPVKDAQGWTSNRMTFQLDPAANQFTLKDCVGGELFMFETYEDAAIACRAVNKSLILA